MYEVKALSKIPLPKVRLHKRLPVRFAVDACYNELTAHLSPKSRYAKVTKGTAETKKWSKAVLMAIAKVDVRKLAFNTAMCRPFGGYMSYIGRDEKGKKVRKPMRLICRNVWFCPHCWGRRIHPMFEDVFKWEKATLQRVVLRPKYDLGLDDLNTALAWLRRSVVRKYNRKSSGWLMVRPVFKSHDVPVQIEVAVAMNGYHKFPPSMTRMVIAKSRSEADKQTALVGISREIHQRPGKKMMKPLAEAFAFPSRERLDTSHNGMLKIIPRFNFLRGRVCLTQFTDMNAKVEDAV